MEEIAGAQGADYAIRNLISAKKLVIESTVKNPLTGKLETQVNTVHGPTAVFQTTTNPRTDAETRSRFILMSVDESPEQTRAILEAQRQSHTLDGWRKRHAREAILRRHHALQRLLKPVVVVNPFEPFLSYPDEQLLVRRDHPKYLHLILAVTFLHQLQRPVKHDAGRWATIIETTLDDIAIANDLAHQLLGHSLDDLSRPSRELLRPHRRSCSAKSRRWFSGQGELQPARVARGVPSGATPACASIWKNWSRWNTSLPLSGRFGQTYQYRLLYAPTDEPGPVFGRAEIRGAVAPGSQPRRCFRPTSHPKTGTSHPPRRFKSARFKTAFQPMNDRAFAESPGQPRTLSGGAYRKIAQQRGAHIRISRGCGMNAPDSVCGIHRSVESAPVLPGHHQKPSGIVSPCSFVRWPVAAWTTCAKSAARPCATISCGCRDGATPSRPCRFTCRRCAGSLSIWKPPTLSWSIRAPESCCPSSPAGCPRWCSRQGEARALLDAPDTQTKIGIRDKAILEMFYSTGIRLAEMARLTIHDADYKNGFVRVNKGKGGKDRVVAAGPQGVRLRARVSAKSPQSNGARPTVTNGLCGCRRNSRTARSKARPLKSWSSTMAARLACRRDVTPARLAAHLRHASGRRWRQHRLRATAAGASLARTTQIYTRTTIAEIKKTFQETSARQAGPARRQHTDAPPDQSHACERAL